MYSNFSFSEETVGFVFNGPLSREVIQKFIFEISQKLDKPYKINLYLEDDHITSFSYIALYKAFRYPLLRPKRFGKVALISDRKWLHFLFWLLSIFMNVNHHNYYTKQRMDAINWIASKSAI